MTSQHMVELPFNIGRQSGVSLLIGRLKGTRIDISVLIQNNGFRNEMASADVSNSRYVEFGETSSR